MAKLNTLITILLALLAVPGWACAEGTARQREKLPLWEFGIVGLAAYLPHYRGSDEYEWWAFPLPYFVYRGEVIKANREGLRTVFWRNEHFETDVSLSGNPPVSSDNEARRGMEELDGLIEIGPALRCYFYELGERDSFYLQGNLRAAFSIGFDGNIDMAHQGYITDFSLVYRNSRLFREHRFRFHLSGGLQVADAQLHSFFYEVAPEFATATRQSYDPQGGYGGFHLSSSMVKELTPRLWVGAYGRWMNSSGAVFADSPLVRTDNNYVFGTMLVWKIGEADRLEK